MLEMLATIDQRVNLQVIARSDEIIDSIIQHINDPIRYSTKYKIQEKIKEIDLNIQTYNENLDQAFLANEYLEDVEVLYFRMQKLMIDRDALNARLKEITDDEEQALQVKYETLYQDIRICDEAA